MLRALSIRDYVIVEALELELAAGFTALTGETGAGKSILVDALALALGARADASVVRAGAARADIAAEFDVAKVPAAARWLAQQEFDEPDGNCVLRRTIDSAGRSRAFVNGRPATAAQLREVGEMLVDIHGQHEHQQLLRRDSQRALLDAFAGAEALSREVAARHAEWRKAAEARAARERAQATSARTRELLAHEVRELESLAFDAQRWREEEAEHRRLAHAQELIESVSACAEALDETDEAVTARLARAAARLAQAAAIDPALEDARRGAEGALAQAQESAHELRRYLQKLDPDPGRFAELEARVKAVIDCARKYRVEPAAIPEVLAERRAQLDELGGAESLEKLKEHESDCERAYRQVAGELSKARRAAAKKLASGTTQAMQRLAMAGGKLDVALEPVETPTAGGLESVELQVAAHAGQPLAPLARVASGGELSRVSLAIQVQLSGTAAVPTLIFDEVDAGIGGAVAEIVGELLQSLGRHHQVLCVTHLAQVAVHARRQLRVAKEAHGRGTVATVSDLDGEAREAEIARMLGGVRITEATRGHAAEMLQNALSGGTPSRKRA
jgi:DNA repair protein RecN (Recombination protein N)